MNPETRNAVGGPTRRLSAAELNACIDALTESFNQLQLGYIRRSKVFAVPSGWRPEGFVIFSWVDRWTNCFLALDIDPRLASRITRYISPRRGSMSDRDVRLALQIIGTDVVSGMQTRLVRDGIMSQISPPDVLTPEEWRRRHPPEVPVGIVPLYSSRGICHLAFNLSA